MTAFTLSIDDRHQVTIAAGDTTHVSLRLNRRIGLDNNFTVHVERFTRDVGFDSDLLTGHASERITHRKAAWVDRNRLWPGSTFEIHTSAMQSLNSVEFSDEAAKQPPPLIDSQDQGTVDVRLTEAFVTAAGKVFLVSISQDGSTVYDGSTSMELCDFQLDLLLRESKFGRDYSLSVSSCQLGEHSDLQLQTRLHSQTLSHLSRLRLHVDA
jgi:hypothetical protein